MRIIPRYVMRGFLLTFAITLLVFTFIMCTMVLFKAVDYIAAGGDLPSIIKIFLTGLPSAMALSIPISVLTAALLTFGRLSAQGEITAMKASGISMKVILVFPILFSGLMAALCFYLNAELAPVSYHIRRQALWKLGTSAPLALIEEGRFISDFPGISFFVGGKKDNRIWDVIIYQQSGKVLRNIRAKNGVVRINPDRSALIVDLMDVRIDPFYEDRPGPGFSKFFPLQVDLPRKAQALNPQKKRSDLTMSELKAQIDSPPDPSAKTTPLEKAQQRMSLIVEYHKRIVLSLSCLAFVALGAPLATRTHRTESSIGIAISLFLVFNFYLFIIVADSLAKRPELKPYLIVWLPIVISFTLGSYLIHRCE